MQTFAANLIIAVLTLVVGCGPSKAQEVAIADKATCAALVKLIRANDIILGGVAPRIKSASEDEERAILWLDKKVPHPELDTGTYSGAQARSRGESAAAAAACNNAETLRHEINELAGTVEEPSVRWASRGFSLDCLELGLGHFGGGESKVWEVQLADFEADEARYVDACKKKFGVGYY